MTTPVARFMKGTCSLDLQSGRYGMGTDFNPPPYLASPLFADGTSANRNGAVKIDETPANRTFAFTVNIIGSSTAEIRRGISDIQSFLAQAGDENEPLYFAFSPNSDTPEPLWGNYGAWLRYEVVHGTMAVSDYLVGARIATDINARIELTVKPFAVGKRQRLASALGGVLEDNYGASDGLSRGLIVPEATTNLFTNPVFGNSTYSTNWTIGSNLTAAQNTDSKFVLPGCLNSMRVFARNTTNNTVTESLTLPASSHTITAYVMLPDLTAPSSTQLQIYYNSAAQTTTYEAIGNNGLYRCYATVTGTGGALATGVVVKNKYTVYLLGMQVEAKAYPTPLCYGDLLGCSWSSTAHASTSTRAVARARLPIADDTLNRGGITFAVALKMHVPNTHANDMNILYVDTLAMQLLYQASTDKWLLHDGTNQAASTAQTFSPGAIYVIHGVYAATNGLTLYINGAADGTNATFTPAATGSYIYIGSNSSPGNNGLITFMDFRVFDVPLTATQVANDYANVSQLTADGQRVGCIPWLWTKDGDDVVDNCDDSTRDNWCVCGGVPGSAEAETIFDMLSSSTVEGEILLSLNRLTSFYSPSGVLYNDLSGTADGASSGGAYQVSTIDTTGLTVVTSYSITGLAYDTFFGGKEIVPIVRMYDVGASLVNYRFYTQFGGDSFYTNTLITAPASWKLYRLNSTRAPETKTTLGFKGLLGLGFIPVRNTGSADIRVDYVDLLTKPLAVWTVFGLTFFVLHNGQAYEYTNTTMAPSVRPTLGDVIDLSPDRINLLTVFQGSRTSDATITYTLTMNKILVIPRYQLL